VIGWPPARRPGACLLLCVALLPVSVRAATPEAAAELELSPCQIASPVSGQRTTARCGRYPVPLDPGQPQGESVELFVAVLPALAPAAPTDAVTLINGGPGASSVDLFLDLQYAFDGLRRERDIVLLDQRGTGRSRPLVCPELAGLEDGMALDLDPAALADATRACLDTLPVDPRPFTTSVAVRDLDRVRAALGYDRLNLYGVSYGTRVALHYLRRYPERTRSLILDGVVPPSQPLGANVAPNAQQSLQALFERCAGDAACADAFADLPGQFAELRRELEQRAVPITLRHPVSGRQESLDFGFPQLAMAVRLLSYAPETRALLPVLIDEAARRNNLQPLAAQALSLAGQLEASLAIGMHNAVACSEDLPRITIDDALRAELDTAYLGAASLDGLAAMCSVWPRGPVDDDFGTPLASDAPVLILSGEDDPITPPAYGERVAKGLPHSRHLIAPGQGHGVIGRGCLARLAADFVDAASTAVLDTACVERLAPQPFFVDLMGPPP